MTPVRPNRCVARLRIRGNGLGDMSALNDVTTRVGPIARGANLAWVADALATRREEILDRWRTVTARQPFHIGRRAPAVADHIPDLFDAIVDLLQRTAPWAALSDSPLLDPAVLKAAREHASLRFEQGLSAGDVLTEFRSAARGRTGDPCRSGRRCTNR